MMSTLRPHVALLALVLAMGQGTGTALEAPLATDLSTRNQIFASFPTAQSASLGISVPPDSVVRLFPNEIESIRIGLGESSAKYLTLAFHLTDGPAIRINVQHAKGKGKIVTGEKDLMPGGQPRIVTTRGGTLQIFLYEVGGYLEIHNQGLEEVTYSPKDFFVSLRTLAKTIAETVSRAPGPVVEVPSLWDSIAPSQGFDSEPGDTPTGAAIDRESLMRIHPGSFWVRMTAWVNTLLEKEFRNRFVAVLANILPKEDGDSTNRVLSVEEEDMRNLGHDDTIHLLLLDRDKLRSVAAKIAAAVKPDNYSVEDVRKFLSKMRAPPGHRETRLETTSLDRFISDVNQILNVNKNNLLPPGSRFDSENFLYLVIDPLEAMLLADLNPKTRASGSFLLISGNMPRTALPTGASSLGRVRIRRSA